MLNFSSIQIVNYNGIHFTRCVVLSLIALISIILFILLSLIKSNGYIVVKVLIALIVVTGAYMINLMSRDYTQEVLVEVNASNNSMAKLANGHNIIEKDNKYFFRKVCLKKDLDNLRNFKEFNAELEREFEDTVGKSNYRRLQEELIAGG